MVINVSGRTDIVAFYMDWFMKRIEEGFFLVRNPFNRNLVHRINYEDVDMIVFCTKNPFPLLKNVSLIDKPFVVQVTLTPYGRDIEPNVPNKQETIEVLKKLAKIIGKDRIFVRYDPIFLNEKYDLEYHVKHFRNIVEELNGCTETIIVSFIDDYKNVRKNIDVLNYRDFSLDDYRVIGEEFSLAASENGMTVQTCGEERTLFEYGFVQGDCVTEDLVYRYSGVNIKKKWISRGNEYCNCVHMYDIGDYNSCKHYCKYCYANYDEGRIESSFGKHRVDSPLLIGELKSTDVIKDIKKDK